MTYAIVLKKGCSFNRERIPETQEPESGICPHCDAYHVYKLADFEPCHICGKTAGKGILTSLQGGLASNMRQNDELKDRNRNKKAI